MVSQLGGPGSVGLVIVVVLVAAVVQLLSGFGFALLCVPMLAVVTDPHTAVLLALVLGMLGALYQAVTGREHLDRPVALRIVVAALFGMPCGLLLFSLTGARALKLVIGATILATTALLARGATIRSRAPAADLGVGVLTGFLTTSTGTSGPPLVAMLQARRVTADVFRATTSTVFCVLDTVALLAFAASGNLTWSVVLLAIGTLPGLGLGAWIGIRLRVHFSPQTFRLFVLVLLALSGLTALGSAVL